jgi:hypothetical protein
VGRKTKLSDEEHIERLQQLFQTAAEVPADELSEWLAARCGDRTELLKDVQRLLDQANRSHDPLEEHWMVQAP